MYTQCITPYIKKVILIWLFTDVIMKPMTGRVIPRRITMLKHNTVLIFMSVIGLVWSPVRVLNLCQAVDPNPQPFLYQVRQSNPILSYNTTAKVTFTCSRLESYAERYRIEKITKSISHSQ